MILRSNGSLGMTQGKPPNALKAKGIEKEEEGRRRRVGNPSVYV
jgi:hypothetical protein